VLTLQTGFVSCKYLILYRSVLSTAYDPKKIHFNGWRSAGWCCGTCVYFSQKKCPFDKDAIRDIGNAYRFKNTFESDVNKLKQLLLTDTSGKLYNEDEKFAVREMLNKETKTDFETGRTVLVNGWILSLTEVRQCALYSLTAA
jgi:hypothetical protein